MAVINPAVTLRELVRRYKLARKYVAHSRQLDERAKEFRKDEREISEDAFHKMASNNPRIRKLQNQQDSLYAEWDRLQALYDTAIENANQDKADATTLLQDAILSYKASEDPIQYLKAQEEADQPMLNATMWNEQAKRLLQRIKNVEKKIDSNFALLESCRKTWFSTKSSISKAVSDLEEQANDYALQAIEIDNKIRRYLSKMNKIVIENGFDKGDFSRNPIEGFEKYFFPEEIQP